MGRINLSVEEQKLIRKVLTWSAGVCILVVAGTWLFFRLQLNSDSDNKANAVSKYDSDKIIEIDVEAHQALAVQYIRIGAPEQALPHLQRLHALFKTDYAITQDLAYASLEAGYYREALSYYDVLLKKMSSDSITAAQCSRRAIALFYLDRLEESESALHECIDRFPEGAEAFCFLGQIEAYRSLPSEKAEKYFRRSIALDSTYTEAWYQLARYYMQQKVYVKARELLLKAVATNPFHNKSHSRLGMVYYYLDYPQLAAKSYQTALALNPNDFNTRYNYGELLYGALGDTAAALEEFKCADSLNPELYEATYKIGLICQHNGMNKEAVRYFREALARRPGDIRMLLQCAVAYEKLEWIDDARECYRNVLKYDELNSVARQKLKLLTGRQLSMADVDRR